MSITLQLHTGVSKTADCLNDTKKRGQVTCRIMYWRIKKRVEPRKTMKVCQMNPVIFKNEALLWIRDEKREKIAG
jgi:hypothetical protein